MSEPEPQPADPEGRIRLRRGRAISRGLVAANIQRAEDDGAVRHRGLNASVQSALLVEPWGDRSPEKEQFSAQQADALCAGARRLLDFADRTGVALDYDWQPEWRRLS